MKKTVGFCLLAALCAIGLLAQDISGTIGGSILDPSGAGVPNAKVTITNVDRNLVVRTITTSTGGVYSAPLIPSGNYSIKVEAKGFKTLTRSGVVVNVSDDLNINIPLQVGAVAETVEVKDEAMPVELASATSATTITGTQVRELQLGTRNYENLVALMPGVTANTTDELYIGNSAPAGTAATIPYSVNGNRNSANNWTVDGADNVDRGSNLTLMMFPSVDAISEFKVERALYTADTGRAGGAQINVVTKSGTSGFHGNLYEFVRNDAFNANNWVNNANKVNVIDGVAKVPPLRWNDFGGTIGGPVPLGGRDKNKTFFFFSEEVRRIHTYTTFNPILPTQGMVQGTFSQPVCISYSFSPAACQATGTQIPATSINPYAAEYIKDIYSKVPLFGVNTVAGTSAQFFPVQNIYNARQEIVRIDQQFTERWQLWGKYENDRIPTTEPGGLFTGAVVPGVATTNTDSPGRAIVVHSVNTIRPNLLNDAAFNFSQSAIHATPAGLASKVNSPDINVPEPYTNTQGVIPTVGFTSGSSIVGYGPYNEFNKNYAFYDGLTWIHGAHTFRVGFSANRYNKTENAASGQGSFSFSTQGLPSGTSSFQQAWANFLLGNVSSFTQPSTDITPNLWAWQHEAWVQDDFKISPRLTVNVGVRWSFFGQPTDTRNLLDNFNPAIYKLSSAPQINTANGTIVANTGSNYLANGIIVGGVSSPYGDHVGNNVYKNFAPRLGIAWDPFGNGKTSIRAGYGVFYDSGLFGTYEQNTFANPPYVSSSTYTNASFSNITGGSAGVAAGSGGTQPLGLHATQIPAMVPYVQQWSLDVQRQLPGDSVLDVSYVGTKGTHLLGIVDINQAPTGVALAAGLHTANGNTIFTTTDDPRINAVRPYLGWNYINTLETAFDSNYHSLQVYFAKRFGGDGTFGAVFTYAKNLTDNGSDRSNAPQNSYNWHEGEYGPATLDRSKVLTMNYVYPIPVFEHSHGWQKHVLGGWQLSGISTIYTGSPFTVSTSNVDPAGAGLLGSSSSASRPDMVCNSPQQNAPQQWGANGSGLTWFATSCFAPVPQGAVRPGNAGRGVVRGPGFANWDASLFKNFSFTERVHMQLRGEFFNILNLVNPSGFGSTNNTSTLFGVITSFRAPRRIQIAAKLTF